jgi:hypothetical protein
MRGDKDAGERVLGLNYYQDIMLKVLPVAMEGKDLGKGCARGSLVDRVMQAGKKV